MKPRARVAVIHPRLGYGGSEAPTLWTIEALKGDYDVTLISMGDVDLKRLNAYYETALAPGDFSVRCVTLPVGLRSPKRFAGLQGRFLQRYVQRVRKEFEVLISCYGPMVLGKPGIQLVADLSFVEEWRFSLHPGVGSWKKWWYGPSPIRQAYLALSDWVSPIDPEAWKQNLTLSNSHWTASLIREKYGIESQVVYPPAVGNFPQIPFAERDNGFVCLGRISPEKRVDTMIAILSKVRQRGHDIHLHVLGGIDDSPYGTKIRTLVERNKEWVFLEGWAAGQRKRELLAGHRYGIHGRDNEPFGIAVAEMVLAGCIVFVPNGGGQVEIVNHPDLVFKNEAEAVEKIEAVITHEADQEKLRAHLRQGTEAFSAEAFMGGIRRTVAELLAKRA